MSRISATKLVASCSFMLVFSCSEAVLHNASLTSFRGRLRAAQQHLIAELPAPASFVHSLNFSHRLRVCNVYPSASKVEVFLGKMPVTDSPMDYKTCREFAPQLQAGDKLEFKVDGAAVGAFVVSELPSNDALLMLVIHRRDATSTAVSFESHVFSNLINAQIAVLDTYKGSKKAAARIKDASTAKTARSEELRFDSVVAVNPGVYEVALQSTDEPSSRAEAVRQLVALNRESYVVLRCGIESDDGAYKQDVIVFPESDPKALTGMAWRLHGRAPMLAMVASVFAVALELMAWT